MKTLLKKINELHDRSYKDNEEDVYNYAVEMVVQVRSVASMTKEDIGESLANALKDSDFNGRVLSIKVK